ncbi:ribosome maturation factor RimM [Lacticaseibacillus casei]|jgi:16S rRNA processing protein RimM|uniref:Ribosome maturation factor RimM n=2 Tax=Lacticaseibacillus TaxID=2759736 RepID=A0ABY9KZ32_9LACO|nr:MULTISPECIES: ribosome maturation factor RimM [Lacticaseibacillus]MDG3060658.1 ribosome maturation factor RimM [Lacticaseibacillus sp. BCRC 81376]QVI37675.1 ribosome maturation factor RimM [Lacticaseibacillus casei]QXG59463.1 ribosome maturation factor RimM [Lacticaseibacillus casei]WFB39078.1 ribosome maturation factor RimM [Lacticaseibacillus huelsenbergensis]WFB40779.1 ribosome maturation factor RimM [Lacticaseibacillus huelsenbergensis]
MPEYYDIGTIVNTHGIRGEVRVLVTTDFPEQRFQVGKTVYVATSPKTALTIQSVRKHKGLTMLTFKGYTDINQVLPFKGKKLQVTDAALQPLEAGSYYYKDIIGLTVIDEHGQTLGQVSEILSPGPNDVWVIPRAGKSEILLPFLKSVVQSIDLEHKEAHVIVPEGLIDDAD